MIFSSPASKRRAVTIASRLAVALVLVASIAPSACLSSGSNAAPPAESDAGASGSDSGLSGFADSGGLPRDAATSTCVPASVQSYVPSWTPPKAPSQACTSGQIAAYATCLASQDPASAACAPWTMGDGGANGACLACLAPSTSTDQAWGPLVLIDGSDLQINVSGCMAIELHDPGSGCAGSFQALQECEAAACAGNCQGASGMALAQCTSAADNGGCASYLASAACVNDAGIAEQCFGAPSDGGVTFEERFRAVASVFCLATGDGG